MRAALNSRGLLERYCVKEGLAGTLLRLHLKQYFTFCRAKADATYKSN